MKKTISHKLGSEAKRGWKSASVFKDTVPVGIPFPPPFASIAETVEALNSQLECGCATDSNFTDIEEGIFSPLKNNLN